MNSLWGRLPFYMIAFWTLHEVEGSMQWVVALMIYGFLFLPRSEGE